METPPSGWPDQVKMLGGVSLCLKICRNECHNSQKLSHRATEYSEGVPQQIAGSTLTSCRCRRDCRQIVLLQCFVTLTNLCRHFVEILFCFDGAAKEQFALRVLCCEHVLAVDCLDFHFALVIGKNDLRFAEIDLGGPEGTISGHDFHFAVAATDVVTRAPYFLVCFHDRVVNYVALFTHLLPQFFLQIFEPFLQIPKIDVPEIHVTKVGIKIEIEIPIAIVPAPERVTFTHFLLDQLHADFLLLAFAQKG